MTHHIPCTIILFCRRTDGQRNTDTNDHFLARVWWDQKTASHVNLMTYQGSITYDEACLVFRTDVQTDAMHKTDDHLLCRAC